MNAENISRKWQKTTAARRSPRHRGEQMKLFVWTNFSPDYTGGLAFAIANDQQEAMRMIEEERGYEVYEWGDLEVLPTNVKVARSVSGGG